RFRPRPVLRRKGVDGKPFDTEVRGGAYGIAQRLDAGAMTGQTRQAAGLRPTTIAVHDDRYMRWISHWFTSGSTPSDLHNLRFLLRQHAVDERDRLVGHLLHACGLDAMLVLTDGVVLFSLLQVVHAVAPHVACCDPGVLGILMRDLGEFLAAL